LGVGDSHNSIHATFLSLKIAREKGRVYQSSVVNKMMLKGLGREILTNLLYHLLRKEVEGEKREPKKMQTLVSSKHL
jgi:hypothetical protein